MNDIEKQAGGAARALRRCVSNILAALKIMVRPARVPMLRGFPPVKKYAIAAAILIAVFVAAMLTIDAPISNAAKNLPRWIVEFFQFITDFGKGAWFAWPLGLMFLALAALSPMASRMSQGVLAAVMVRIGFLFVAIGLPGLFASLIKNMIGRARPSLTGISNPMLFDPFHFAPAFASMPSGHATTAFAALAAIGTLWPRWRTELLIYALLIAVSRIVVLAHFPTDVAAGALVGIGGVLLVRRWFAARRLGFSIGPDGVVHPLPGPTLKRIKSVARAYLAE